MSSFPDISDVLNQTFEAEFAKVLTDLLLSCDDTPNIQFDVQSPNISEHLGFKDAFPAESHIAPLVPPLLSVMMANGRRKQKVTTESHDESHKEKLTFRDPLVEKPTAEDLSIRFWEESGGVDIGTSDERQNWKTDHRRLCLGVWAQGWSTIPFARMAQWSSDEEINREIDGRNYQEIAQQADQRSSNISPSDVSDPIIPVRRSVDIFLRVIRSESTNLKFSNSSVHGVADLLPQILSRHVLSRSILASRDLVIKSFKRSIRSVALKEASNAFELAVQLSDLSNLSSSSMDTSHPVIHKLSDLVPWMIPQSSTTSVQMARHLLFSNLFIHSSPLPQQMPKLLSEILSILPHDVFLLFYLRLWGFGLLVIRRIAFVFLQLTSCSLEQELIELKQNLNTVVSRVQQPFGRKKGSVISLSKSQQSDSQNGIRYATTGERHVIDSNRLEGFRSCELNCELNRSTMGVEEVDDEDFDLLIEEYASKKSTLVQSCEHLGLTVAQRVGDIVKDTSRATEAEAEGCLSRWVAFLQVSQSHNID